MLSNLSIYINIQIFNINFSIRYSIIKLASPSLCSFRLIRCATIFKRTSCASIILWVSFMFHTARLIILLCCSNLSTSTSLFFVWCSKLRVLSYALAILRIQFLFLMFIFLYLDSWNFLLFWKIVLNDLINFVLLINLALKLILFHIICLIMW